MIGEGESMILCMHYPSTHSTHWLSALRFSFVPLISHKAILAKVRYLCYTHTMNFWGSAFDTWSYKSLQRSQEAGTCYTKEKAENAFKSPASPP